MRDLVKNLRATPFGYANTAADRIETLEKRIKALEAAMRDFIAKVDRGEARSTHSYSVFKSLLAQHEHVTTSDLHKTMDQAIANGWQPLSDYELLYTLPSTGAQP